MGGFLQKTELPDITIYPTVRLRGDDLSAVVISAESVHSSSARTVANRKFKMLCALSALTCGQPFIQSFPKIPAKKSVKKIQSLSPDLDHILRVPYILNPQCSGQSASERTAWIYNAIAQANQDDLELFTRAVFAYDTGCRSRELMTLAVVAYAAAMAALAEEFKKACTGESCCSICGPLPGKHNLAGEGKAILLLVQSTRELSTHEQRIVKKLIDRIYSKQRSSYVHAAETRHNENGEEETDISLIPTDKLPAQEIYYFQNDAQNFARLTRRSLIRWISMRTNTPFNPEHVNMSKDAIFTNTHFMLSVGLKAKVWAKIDPF